MELVWSVDLGRRLSDDLLSKAPHEHGGAILAHIDDTGPERRYLAFDYVLPADDEVRGGLLDELWIDPSFWARVAKEARYLNASVLPVHTHPVGSEAPRFSTIDDEGEQRLLPVLERLTGSVAGAVVIGPGGATVGMWTSDGRRVIGRCRDLTEGPLLRSKLQGGQDDSRFSRSIAAFGSDGQARLSSLSVGIVGASGTGSHVCEQLIRLGVGELVVIDSDSVEIQNLNRIVTAFADDASAGRDKSQTVHAYATRVDGPTRVVPITGDVRAADVVQRLYQCDAIIGCTDTLTSRAVLNRIAVQRFIPLWDCGTEISIAAGHRLRAFANLRIVMSGGPCLVCMGTIDPELLRIETLPPGEAARERGLGYIRGANVPAPSVVSLNGIAASLAVLSFLRWAVGDPGISPGQWVFRLATNDIRQLGAERLADCAVCGADARLGRVELAVTL